MAGRSEAGESIPIDHHLLSGFDFSCRPDCGLCCYARPLVMAPERERLLQIEPQAPIVDERPGVWSIPSRPQGGACQFLRENRCRVHPARPFPCAQFPIDTHLGTRVQLTLVFSCPGISLDPLMQWATGRSPAHAPVGLEAEWAAVDRELSLGGAASGVLEATHQRGRLRRQLERLGLWETEDRLRAATRAELPAVARGRFPVVELPARQDGLENLPLFFHARYGRVAIGAAPGGWELLGLSEGGGEPAELGIFSVPEQAPRLTTEGDRLLRGYLTYVLERDQFVWELFFRLLAGESGHPTALARESLSDVAADVLCRGSVRAKLDGGTGETLTAREVADGIRATDADLLDRPTLGSRL